MNSRWAGKLLFTYMQTLNKLKRIVQDWAWSTWQIFVSDNLLSRITLLQESSKMISKNGRTREVVKKIKFEKHTKVAKFHETSRSWFHLQLRERNTGRYRNKMKLSSFKQSIPPNFTWNCSYFSLLKNTDPTQSLWSLAHENRII